MVKSDIEDDTTHNEGESGGGNATAGSHPKKEETPEVPEPSEKDEKDINDLLTGLVVPVLAGIYGGFAIQTAAVANDQSQMANQLALLSLCYINSSHSVCAHLLTQTDLYLPTIANKLYGLSPTSGKGVQQPIARPPSKNATAAIYTVQPQGSTLGYSEVNSSINVYYGFLCVLCLFPLVELAGKFWIFWRLQRAGTNGLRFGRPRGAWWNLREPGGAWRRLVESGSA